MISKKYDLKKAGKLKWSNPKNTRIGGKKGKVTIDPSGKRKRAYDKWGKKLSKFGSN